MCAEPADLWMLEPADSAELRTAESADYGTTALRSFVLVLVKVIYLSTSIFRLPLLLSPRETHRSMVGALGLVIAVASVDAMSFHATSPRHSIHVNMRGRSTAVMQDTNIASAARLFLMEAWLKLRMKLDPNIKLYQLPQRQIISSEEDIFTIAQAFPTKVRGQFMNWYKMYKAEVTAPKPFGSGLSEAEVLVIFNRIVDRLILLSKQP